MAYDPMNIIALIEKYSDAHVVDSAAAERLVKRSGFAIENVNLR